MAIELDFPDPCQGVCPLFQEAMDAAGVEACIPAAEPEITPDC